MSLYAGMIHDFKNDQLKYGTRRLKSIVSSANEKIIPILESYNISEDSFLLLLTGSDGRKENRIDASGVEMIAYTKTDLLKTTIIDLSKEIGELFIGYNRLSLTKKVYGTNRVEVEPKGFSAVSDFEDPFTNYHVFFPSRFMDGAVLFGTEEIYNQVFSIFHKNIIEAKGNDMSTFKSRIKYAEDITLQGKREFKGVNVTHFDFIKGEVYYEKTAQIERGLKMGPLRYVQYKLCFLITQLLRNQMINHQDFFGFESFIANKIEFLRTYIKGGLDESKISSLQTIYYTFLKIHHICQKEYKDTEGHFIYELTPDDSKLLQDMTRELYALINTLKVL